MRYKAKFWDVKSIMRTKNASQTVRYEVLLWDLKSHSFWDINLELRDTVAIARYQIKMWDIKSHCDI